MKAKLIKSSKSHTYTFSIDHEDSNFSVTLLVNENGRFIHESITHPSGEELDYEGEEGQIRDDILDYLDENWEKLV